MAVTARANEDRASLGIAMTLAAWAFFTVVDGSMKWLAVAGFPAAQLAFMRYLPHFAISTGLLLLRSGARWDVFGTSHLGLCLLRGVLLASATFFNFVALKFLPLTVTGSVMFSAPIIVCALSWPLLGERVGPWRWFAIALGFIGVLVVIRPFDATFHWAALLSVYNALALSLYSIITRKLSGIVAAETMQFYMGLVGTLLTLPAALWLWQDPGTALNWGLMLLAGTAAWAGHELFSRAHGFAPANTLIPYTYSFLIYMTLAGYLIFGDMPDGLTLLGAGIIILSGLIIWRRAMIREV
ncbi:DMT family transporter [Thalassococcus sp. S3]|uniref:DMT family transporter n=1 Tax=Thalassococcus sp. S3 TaxID=2017482 RepID=UPI0010247D1F|nr:DMT family transporter [Thalassococcus sp. S3]QBF34317.1 multidrug transporter [Thalassococcus sp. S3]